MAATVTVTVAAITTTATLRKSPATFYSPSPQTHNNFSFSGGLRLPTLTIKLKTRSRRSGGVFGAKMTDSAAGSYAAALAEVANSNGTLDATLSDIEKINKLFSDNESALSFFTSPIVTLEQKHKLIDDITSSGLLQLHVCNFINILVERNRIGLVKEIGKEFEIVYNRLTGTEMAVVSSVVKLEKQHLAQIAKQVQRLTGARNVRIKTAIDEALVAGFTIRYGSSLSKLIDMSVKKQLDDITARLEIVDVVIPV